MFPQCGSNKRSHYNLSESVCKVVIITGNEFRSSPDIAKLSWSARVENLSERSTWALKIVTWALKIVT